MFDFDGVIANTFQMCYGINRMSDPELTEDEYREKFEGNINHATPKRKPIKEVDFFTEFEKCILDAPLPPGIADAIQYLGSKYKMVIVSSTITPLIERYLTKHNLLVFFQEILGNDVAASKVEKFNMVFERYATNGDDSVLITDTLGDIREAKHVSMHTIAVTWGYQHRSTLEKGEPDTIIENPSKIIRAISDAFDESWELESEKPMH